MNLNIFKEATQQQILEQVNRLTAYTEMIAREQTVGSWGGFQTLLRNGLIRTVADAGTQVNVGIGGTEWVFDVEGIDEMQTVDETLRHNVPILMHKVYEQYAFDPEQYLFTVTAESLADLGISGNVLPAGTYHITLDHGAYSGGTGEDGTYQFTTTQDIPIGGGIRHTTMGMSQTTYAVTNITGGTFTTYGADTLTTIETDIAATVGSSGINLGTTTASNPSYKVGDYINFTQRQRYGSNRWSTSWIRQLLNSEDAAFAFSPQTIFSRDVSFQTTPEGFLHAIDPELRAVLAKTRTRYAKSISDGYGYEDVEDFVTLETMLDVYGSNNNSIAEGPVTAAGTVTRTTYTSLWKNAVQADKIKYQGTTARYWWLSSCNSFNGERVYFIYTSGSMSSDARVFSSFGVVPRLTIA